MKNVTKIDRVDLSIFKKTRVAAYCRVSTDSDEQELSLDAQKKHYESYIKSNSEWEYAGNGNMQGFIMMMASVVQKRQNERVC